jgi:nuclear transport factor 2 (NTF2) superfamily protein
MKKKVSFTSFYTGDRFTEVQLAEDAWNSRDSEIVSLA